MQDIYIKYADKNILKELDSIKFDSCYSNIAVNKYSGKSIKIYNLKPYEANILKQICLSLGFDCAVSRDTVTCKCDTTDAILFASFNQLEKLIKKLYQQPFRLKKLADEINSVLNNSLDPLVIRNFVFDWSRPYIMGILNVTPDSFSDGGNFNNFDTALKHCIQMIEEGADIIDIGGESTRPNAEFVSVEEEINRVIPVIQAIKKENINIPISVDTRNYQTAKMALESGADIINDVSGLEYDIKLFDYVSQNNIPTVIMHSDKVPAVSSDFVNKDVVEEVYLSLYSKIQKLKNAGMEKKNIIFDVGIGFGKSAESNFELLKRLDEFTSLGAPMLLGLSRKSFIRNTFNIDCEHSDIPTALYSCICKSANIHRVHNVKLTKQYLDFSSKLA